jgi:hypothetical protein
VLTIVIFRLLGARGRYGKGEYYQQQRAQVHGILEAIQSRKVVRLFSSMATPVQITPLHY